MSIFLANLDLVQNFNADEMGFTIGINQFSDWSNEDYSSMLGLSPPDGYTVTYPPEGYVPPMDATSYPASLNWVTKGAITSQIKN